MTSEASLMPDLVNVYRAGLDKDGCAVMNVASGPVVNPGCPIVKKDMCVAGKAVWEVERTAEQPELASKQEEAMRNIGCPIAP